MLLPLLGVQSATTLTLCAVCYCPYSECSVLLPLLRLQCATALTYGVWHVVIDGGQELIVCTPRLLACRGRGGRGRGAESEAGEGQGQGEGQGGRSRVRESESA